jgi:hypothetical protein
MVHIPGLFLALDYSGKSEYKIADEVSIHMIKTLITISSPTEDICNDTITDQTSNSNIPCAHLHVSTTSVAGSRQGARG